MVAVFSNETLKQWRKTCEHMDGRIDHLAGLLAEERAGEQDGAILLALVEIRGDLRHLLTLVDCARGD